MFGIAARAHSHRNIDGYAIGSLALRLFVGSFTLLAGVQILVSDADFAEYVRPTGVPLPAVAGFLVMCGHLGLGALLIAGLFTRLTGILLAVKFLLVFSVYYVAQFDNTLTLTPVGTLWGVESLSYGMAGILFACVGAGTFSLDAVLRSWWLRRTSRSSPFIRLVCGEAERHPAIRGAHTVPTAGHLVFRLSTGGLLVVHGINQIVSATESMTTLASKLAALGIPFPTFAAWTVTLTMLVVGALLILGTFTRAGGLLLAAIATVLLLAVPELGGTTIEGYGFHGEEFFFLAVVGIFFATNGSGPLAVRLTRTTSPAAGTVAPARRH